MTNLTLELFDRLMDFDEDLREMVIEGYDRAETLEQELALGYMRLRPKFVYNAGRQFPVLAIWD